MRRPFKKTMKGFPKGQSLAEYAIVATIIAAALAVMGPGFRWSVQRVVKSTADSIGFQAGSEQASNPEEGFLNSQTSNSRATRTETVTQTASKYQTTASETSNIQTISYTNGAFTRD